MCSKQSGGMNAGCYLPVGVSVVLVCSGVIILLDEAKILLSLSLENQLPAIHISREVALKDRETGQGHEAGIRRETVSLPHYFFSFNI